MLKTLRIKNFAIIESLELDLSPGLTAFTGETGAGKTIIVEAIRLLLGARASKEMIRTGADLTVVEGLFSGPFPESLYDLAGGKEIWLRRELSGRGASRAFAGDRQVALAELQQIGETLADLCGQHQQQMLLDPNRHLEILDQFAGLADDVVAFRALYQNHLRLRGALKRAEENLQRSRETEELRRFQITEIRNAAISPGEEEALKEEAEILKHARRLSDSAQQALTALSEDDESVETVLGRLLRESERLTGIDARWEEFRDRLALIRDSVSDLSGQLAAYGGQLEFDPARVDTIEARRAELYKLKSKYGGTLEAVSEHLKTLEAEDSESGTLAADVARLKAEFAASDSSLYTAAHQLSGQREKAASGLATAVNKRIRKLGMAGARIRAELTPYADGGINLAHRGQTLTCREDGADALCFTFEANPREGFKPLQKIASGGELSRLLLAFKGAIRVATPNQLYIFDEIDSGIGGKTAGLVAAEIKSLASDAQVFVNSHLQQLAAPADHHFVIEKTTQGRRATIGVRSVTGKERVHELARMVSGDKVTDSSLEFASELAGQND